MILVYSNQTSPRLVYVLNLVFKNLLKSNFELTQSPEVYRDYAGLKMAYSAQKIDDGIHIKPHSLLFETEIKPQKVQVVYENALPTFFQTGDAAHSFSFDIFAAAFYMVSRYEEYLPHKADQYDRFQAAESLAYQHNFLQTAVVNHWVNLLKNAIEQRFNGFLFAKQTYVFTPTIDIDFAFAYKHKPYLERTKSLAYKLLKGKVNEYKTQKKVLDNKLQDPYNTYNYLGDLHEKYGLKPIYFYLFGNYGGLDQNLDPKNIQVKKLVQYLAQIAQVGLHPSVASNKNEQILEREIHLLRAYTQNSNVVSRQHFLMLKMPKTYQTLIKQSVTADYSMAFADELGFRAGIASPFIFFDLSTNQPTKLTNFPCAIMDATLLFYKKLSPSQANEAIKPIINEVKAVKGNLISIWHNNSVSDFAEWKGWRIVYERFLLDALA